MEAIANRIRSIRRKANKRIDKKHNTVTVCADDFFWVLTMVNVSDKLEMLEEQNKRLYEKMMDYKTKWEGVEHEKREVLHS